ncbi:hypothetical protein RHEC894_CH01700 [Rhizobium sp. CIAT894]|nr:hypothetical protein RHEC894_CH01700 [Rhizobium sp. CIAT894]
MLVMRHLWPVRPAESKGTSQTLELFHSLCCGGNEGRLLPVHHGLHQPAPRKKSTMPAGRGLPFAADPSEMGSAPACPQPRRFVSRVSEGCR